MKFDGNKSAVRQVATRHGTTDRMFQCGVEAQVWVLRPVSCVQTLKSLRLWCCDQLSQRRPNEQLPCHENKAQRERAGASSRLHD